MKTKNRNNKREEHLNTNEVMHDYEFHLKIIMQQQKLDFENEDPPEPTA